MSAPTFSSLGWDAERAAAFAALDDDSLTPARVTRVDRGGCDLLTADGPWRATYGSGVLTTLPCTGDWIGARRWPDDRVTIEVVLERRTLVQRVVVTPGQSASQPLVANVDVVLIAEGAVPDPDLGRLERLLAVAWESGAAPVILLTKADLAGDAIDVLVDDVVAIAPGAPVHAVSSVTGDGLEGVREHLGPGRTAALLGASGVGKSTLVNALAGVTVMATRMLRADGKGRHTTVTRELIPLPDGTVLVDTPGLRSIGLNVARENVGRVFADIEELASRCRFGDCTHEVEPDCAVRAALDAGELAERRMRSWRKLQREALYQQARVDQRLRAERRKEQLRRGREARDARGRARR
ncbi:MAG: ribosome small subunit-dependent GTPase A [Streptosporangiales bacterium]|nr:ribosome small subunit-dependent GTPase A [Streptosporangiales bacterium]